MANTEQIRFRTKVCFIASQGILKTSESTLKLNLSEQYILNHLIKNHSTPVTKDDLLKVGWPDRIVTEASLFQVIRALRVKLNEKSKGDVIETLPRIGYQIREFIREEVDLSEQQTSNITNKKKFISLGAISIVLLGCCVWYLSPSQTKPTNFLIENENIGSNNITFITNNLEQQVDLRYKAKAIFSAQSDNNQKIYFYKSHDYYSIAWCQVTLDTDQCKPQTDFSYKIAPDAWNNFVRNITDNKERFHKKIDNKSDVMQGPLSIAYRSYINRNGMISKISNFYISPTDKHNLFDYSKVNFTTDNKKGHYQALSLSTESLTVIKKDSQFIATLKIMPKFFQWAYQNNVTVNNQKEIIFSDDDNGTGIYKSNTMHYDYIVAAQKRLKLILNESSGLYWLHSSKNNPQVFLPTEHYK